MEHRLIQGGEQWLPFARSRIKALRATGLAYSSQRFTMPDDTDVAVRVVGNNEFITISGGGCILRMDSGIVNTVPIFRRINEGVFEAGILHETDAVKTYNSNFVLPDGGGKWRYLKSQTSAGQFTGTVTTGKLFKGKVPLDKLPARSFSPKKIKAETDPITYIDSSSDEYLFSKGYAASECPASMFTGRCRLYVQAMYGRHLYDSESSEDAAITPTLGDAAAGGPPFLEISAYKKTGEDDFGAVSIRTSSGVHLDSKGRHWLFSVNNATIVVHPLIASPCGEKQRARLWGEDKLTGDDAEHLETYILSTCRPYSKKAVTLDLGASVSAYSMGYGWHWNWDGNSADIVINESFEQPRVGVNTPSAMRSKHYRITTALTGDVWTANRTLVEGPKDWAVHRSYYVITELEWARKASSKTTSFRSTLFNCDAPFYVFYLRNELQVCRVNVVITPTIPAIEIASDGFGGGQEFTVGLRNGFVERRGTIAEFATVTFSVGNRTTNPMTMQKFVSSENVIARNKTVVSPPVPGGGNLSEGLATYLFGYPTVVNNVSTYESVQIFSAEQVDTPPVIGSERESNVTTVATSSIATLIVPFYDAEAIYFQAQKYSLTTVYDRIVTQHQTNALAASRHPEFRNADNTWRRGEPFIYFLGGGLGAAVSAPTNPLPTEAMTSASVVEVLVCHGGAVPAFLTPVLSSFHDAPADEAAGLKATSGTRTTNPVVIANNASTVGTPITPGKFALVGWV